MRQGVMVERTYFVFDVESVGLHGEAFAFGYVVVNDAGVEREAGRYYCWPDNAAGRPADREWVRANCPIPDGVPACTNPAELRATFWRIWTGWRCFDAIMVADCAWPVEARFLASCIDVDPEARAWSGPYPLHDVATARLAAGLDPLATVARLPNEEPKHDPLADARQSTRLFLEALHRSTPTSGTVPAGPAKETS